MYTERVNFIDKIVNLITSPFDKYINLDDRSDEYLRILGNGEDISKLSQKWIKYYYLTIHAKMYSILSTVYDSYTDEHENIFVPVNTRLDDLYLDLRNTWRKFDSYPFIQEMKLGDYKGFGSLNAEPEYRKRLWKSCKNMLLEDTQGIPELPTHQLTNDLKLAYKEIDELIKEHEILVKNTLFGTGIIEYKIFKINTNDYTVSINGSEWKPFNPNTQEFVLLLLLLRNIGKPITYHEMATELKLNAFDGDVTSDVKSSIQQIKKGVFYKIRDLGFSEKDSKTVRDYIRFITNHGAIIDTQK